jgi:hypothetical protein
MKQLWTVSHAWIIGFIIIGLSSYTRFNIPPTSRSSTTWHRYHTVAFIYAAVAIAGWLVLATTPELLGYLGVQAKLDEQVIRLAVPLYAALVLTALVSSFKPFQKADEKLRTFFHDMARIPWEAQRLSAALLAKTWLPSSALQDQVRATLRSADVDADDISFADDGSPQARWTKLSALHDHVHRWQRGEQRRFAAFYSQHLSEFQALSDHYDTLAAAARRLVHLLDTLRSTPGDPKLSQVQEELIKGFVDGALRLEKDICDLASRALLKCTLTEKARREELESMGFVVNVSPNPLFDRLLLLYVILTVLYIVSLWLADRPWYGLTGVIIGTIYMGAVASAIYLKRWPWARPTPAGRPIRGYILSGFLAAVIAIVASFGMGVLLTWDVKAAGQLLVARWWPWSLMAAFTAVATAYNIDNEEWSGRLWFEAALQSVGGMVMALFVYMQLMELCGGTSDPNCVPSLVRVIFLAAVSGGLIGWLVPTWFREPQTMTVNYKGHKVTVTATVSPNSNIIPVIRVLRSHQWGQSRDADAQGSLLPFEQEFVAAEEALAKAVEYARKQIDVNLEGTGPARSSAA